jgi:hypothetical protein
MQRNGLLRKMVHQSLLGGNSVSKDDFSALVMLLIILLASVFTVKYIKTEAKEYRENNVHSYLQ